MGMGKHSGLERTSLDRLKALDNLSSIEAQLDEAQQLCTHPARADMILRWLTGKLASSQDARSSSRSWTLFASAVRLVSKQKIVVLLGANTFIDLLRMSFADSKLPAESLVELANLVNLLLECAQDPDGAAVKTVFIVSSDTAAALCGCWLQRIYDTYVDGTTSSHRSTFELLMNPPLQIWALRKHSPSDDASFSSNCMLPALLLLAILNESGAQTPSKRKRGHVSHKRDIVSSLESLIAIHTTSPTRSAFFETKISSLSKPQDESFVHQPAMKERLGPLKMALLHGFYSHVFSTVPLLLNIAVRSVPMHTPKERLNERPWIEELFNALRSCISRTRPECDSRVSLEMLEVVHSCGLSMSTNVLSNVIKQQSLSTGQGQSVDWKLIATVLTMENSIFVDDSLAGAIFDAMTAQGEQTFNGETRRTQKSVTLQDDILIPIMEAFVKNGKTDEFVKAWRKQLLLIEDSSEVSIWTDVAPVFGDLLAGSLSSEQIVRLFDSLIQPLHEWISSPKPAPSQDWSTQAPNFTQLFAIVHGIRSPDALRKLHDRLGVLVRDLFNLNIAGQSQIPILGLNDLLKLLRRSFELWYPMWAAEHSERERVASLGVSLFDSALVRGAREICVHADSRAAHAARDLIACICDHFQHYNEHNECFRLFTENVQVLGSLEESQARDVFVKHPTLLCALDPARRQGLLIDNLLSTSLGSQGPQSACSIADELGSTGHSFPLDTAILQVSTEFSKRTTATSPAKISSLLCFLSSVNHDTFTQEQCSILLDALLELSTSSLGGLSRENIQQTLSVICALIPGAQKDAVILKDVSAVWRLAESIDVKDRGDSIQSVTIDSKKILEEITRTLLKSWLSSKVHRERGTLSLFTKTMNERIRRRMKKGGWIDCAGTLAVAKTAILFLSTNIPDEHPGHLSQQDREMIEAFAESLVKEAESISDSEKTSNRSESAQSLVSILGVLAAIPLSSRSGTTLVSLGGRILTLARRFISVRSPYPCGAECAVKCISLIQRYGEESLESLTCLVEGQLTSTLDAVSHEDLLDEYANAVRGADIGSKVSVLTSLSQRLRYSHSALLLYGKIALTLKREDLKDKGTSADKEGLLSGTQVTQPILQAAAHGERFASKCAAMRLMIVLTKRQPYLLNQYGVELIITSLYQLATTCSYVGAIYAEICDLLTALFATQRARLQGRFHLLVALFQSLLSALFQDPSTKTQIRSSPQHARALARLLESFCKPPQPRRKEKKSELIDEARKAEAHAGQYAPYILHHYCSKILDGPLGDGVREALTPGLWAMIEAIEVNNLEGIKALSAAMNNSERAILRSLYDDWKRFGKWEGS